MNRRALRLAAVDKPLQPRKRLRYALILIMSLVGSAITLRTSLIETKQAETTGFPDKKTLNLAYPLTQPFL